MRFIALVLIAAFLSLGCAKLAAIRDCIGATAEQPDTDPNDDPATE